MSQKAPSVLLLGVLLSLSASARGLGADHEASLCTELVDASPSYSAGIGVLVHYTVSGSVVEEAVGQWKVCEGYGTEFPPFLVGSNGSQTVLVRYGGRSDHPNRCGSFNGAIIHLYSSTLDDNGRLVSCGPQAELLAHELGHALGLDDAPKAKACRAHAMARIHATERNHRSVQPGECGTVGRRWVTPFEEDQPTLVSKVGSRGDP